MLVIIIRSCCLLFKYEGGSAWESNPPRPATRPVTGFEDRGAHRDPTTPVNVKHTASQTILQGKVFCCFLKEAPQICSQALLDFHNERKPCAGV